MKRFVILLILMAAFGATAWGLGALASQTAVDRWFEARRSDGWVANLGAVQVGGFPTRFTTRLSDITLADPVAGLAWTSPDLTISQQVLWLDRLALTWPDRQSFSTPRANLSLSHDLLYAALDVQPGNRMALDAAEIRAQELQLTSDAPWQITVTAADLALMRRPQTQSTYTLALDARQMVPPLPWRQRLDPAGLLPEAIARTVLRAEVQFDAPWDLDAIESVRPQPARIDVEELDAAWGAMLFRATGSLQVTPGGVPEGALAIRAENWREMLSLAENAGLVPERMGQTIEAMLEVLAGLNGSPDHIDATLSFSNGRVFLGPLPIGIAPRLRLP